MTIDFITLKELKTEDCLLSVTTKGALGEGGRLLDKTCNGLLSATITETKTRLAASPSITVTYSAGEKTLRRLICLVGSHKKDTDDDNQNDNQNENENDKENDKAALLFGGRAYGMAHQLGFTKAALLFEPENVPCDAKQAVTVAMGAFLKQYRFDTYRTQIKDEEKKSVEHLLIVCDDAALAKKTWEQERHLLEGVVMARDLVFEPANVLNPQTFSEQCASLKEHGVETEILDKKALEDLGMGALLGVAQGSAQAPYVAVMQWKGGDSKTPPLAFIGKGVTFDTGGISIKPSSGMEEMKMDMAGAATVTGLMRCLAGRKAKVNVVGVVGLVENMPSSNAQRPGDIVRSHSGQTIEVLNTDAEGRLVLADILSYTNERFDPRFMINLATLTGAVIVALGNEHAGLFSNDDTLAKRITEAATKTGEWVWRLPLGKNFDKLIDSPIADMQNITNQRGAGSITAAQFLKRFVGKTPWAHLDIAGVAWNDKATAIAPKGGSGYGVRLLNQLIAQHYES